MEILDTLVWFYAGWRVFYGLTWLGYWWFFAPVEEVD